MAVTGALLAFGQCAFAADGVSGSLPQATAEAAPFLRAQPENGFAGVTLTKEHQRVLLANAIDHYSKAQSTAVKDSADAKQAFGDAAEKFELLITSGVRNSRLFLIFDIRSAWKTMASAAIVLFAVTATSYTMSWQESARRVAVVITDDVILHESDGPNFPTVPQSQVGEGQTVELFKRRGDWLQIRTENGQIGWLPRKAAEVI